MKQTIELAWVNFCLLYFLFIMVWKKKILQKHCFKLISHQGKNKNGWWLRTWYIRCEQKRGVPIGWWRKVHNENLHNLCSSLNISSIIKSQGNQISGVCSIHGEDDTCKKKITVRILDGKRLFLRLGYRWQGYIKMDLRELSSEMSPGFKWLRTVSSRRFLWKRSCTFGFHKRWAIP
jgi:hypothetical protein